MSRIFISYSSPDAAKANAIRAALEAAGIGCWIAPRDLAPGTQWGAGIVQAIAACEAVLVVFSQAANASPQVAREMELAVSRRRPLIPVRVADDMPTDDMQYFLGVSHWFNAYAQPIETYLPDIVAATHAVLRRERSPWNSFQRRLPRTRAGQIVLTVAAAVVLAVIVAVVARPPNPADAMTSPLAGRWETRLPDGKGGQTDCVVDVQKTGMATYSDDCPLPLTGAAGSLATSKDGTWAPALFRPGDNGTFLLQGGPANGLTGAFRRSLFGGLQTTDAQLGVLHWRRIAANGPLHSAVGDIVPNPAAWPLPDLPKIAARSKAYVQAKWRSDAELTAIDVKLVKSNEAGVVNVHTPDGGVDLELTFYSPSTQQGLQFTPGASLTSPLYPLGVVDRYGEGPLPDDFMDLPQAAALLKQNGMRADQIYEGRLQDWGNETTAGSARLSGVEWMIDSELGERFVVRAAK